jgi:ferric-dicitrate binding protein FerR (iron transport regulator)
VERAERSPFYVNIGDMTVKVVGTSFNLKEGEQGRIELWVVQGDVLFYVTGNQDETIRLTAGQRCLFDPQTGKYQTDTIPSNNYLYWKTRRLTYRNESLDSVFQELEVIFKKEIIVSDSLILQNRWNSTHEGQDLNEIVGLICEYFELEYTEKEDTISIQRKQE